MKKISISSISCDHQITDPGDDDMFILVQLDGGAPIRHPLVGTYSMKKTTEKSFSPAVEFYYEKNAFISLWDRDGVANFINAADMCGSFNIMNDLADGSHTFWTVGDHNAQYKMAFTTETVADVPNTTSLGDVTSDVADALSSVQSSITDMLDEWDDLNEVLGMTDTSDLNDALSGAVSGGLLDPVIKVLNNPSIASVFPVKAVSFGIMGQAEIFAGISGNFGCAASLANMNPDNFDDNYTIFAGGGIAEGADAGIEAALAVGLWFQDVTDIGGVYVGAEADVADGAGASAVAYASSDDKDAFKEEGSARGIVNLDYAKVIFIGLDVGMDDGVECEETYFFAGHLESAQVSQTGDYNHQAIVTWVSCLHMENDDKDDVHFHYYADGDNTQYRYPIWNDVQMTDDKSGDGVNLPGVYGEPETDTPNATYLKTYRNAGQMIQFNDYFEISLHLNGKDLGHKTVHWSDFDGGTTQAALSWSDTENNGKTKYHYELKFNIVTS